MNNTNREQSAEADAGRVLMTLIASGHALEARLESALESHGLSLSKLNVLTLLAEAKESLVLSELASRLKCVRSNVTQLMDKLEGEGLVRRLYDVTDRRTIRAELTQLGREKQEIGSRAAAEITGALTQGLSHDDLEALARLAGALR